MIAFKIKEDMYGIPIHIAIGEYNECKEYLCKKYNLEKNEQEYYGGCCEWYKDGNFALATIWMPEFDYSDVNDVVTLVHEIDHAAFYIFELMNIPILDNSSNHAYIYLKEYLTKKALTKLKRLTNDN